MKILVISLLIAVVVSLLAYRSIFVHHANSATSNVPKALTSKPISMPAVLTAYVPEPGSKTKTGLDANSRPGIASHLAIFPIGTKINILNKEGTSVTTYVVDDRIPVGKVEETKYAITPDDLRAGKMIHIDLRIPPKYDGTDDRSALDEAIASANKIGRRKIYVSVIFPPNSAITADCFLTQKGACI